MGLPLGGASGLPERTVNVSLYRRGTIWWIELSSKSGRIRESSGSADKKAAQEYHEKRKGELWRQDKLGEAPPITWGAAIKKWQGIKARGLPDRYRLAAMGIDLETTLPLTQKQIEREIEEHESAGSFNRTLALIVAIHNAAGVEPVKIERRPMPPGRTRWLTAEEWDRLREALEIESPLLLVAAEFTLETGLRENNVLNLEWTQIDLRRRVAWLHGDEMKGGEPLSVPLNDAACAILERRNGIHKTYVFAHPESGQPLYKASNRAWYAALRRAKLYRRVPGKKRLEVCWHTLRHTWASWHRMNGTSMDTLQDLGGWKDPKMVRRYAHLSAGHLASAAANVKPVSLSYNAPKPRLPRTTAPTKGR